MKKRLRRKLGKGEYAYPNSPTRRERLGNLLMRIKLQGIVDRIGPAEFIRRIKAADESHYPPAPAPCMYPVHPNDHPVS